MDKVNTEDCKKFLNETYSLTQSSWKRVSKKKDKKVGHKKMINFFYLIKY